MHHLKPWIIFFPEEYAPSPLEQITGWLCQLWCVKINAPHRLSIARPATGERQYVTIQKDKWIKSSMCFHLYLMLWL